MKKPTKIRCVCNRCDKEFYKILSLTKVAKKALRKMEHFISICPQCLPTALKEWDEYDEKAKA